MGILPLGEAADPSRKFNYNPLVAVKFKAGTLKRHSRSLRIAG